MKKIWSSFTSWIVAYFEGARFSTSRSRVPGAVQDARFDCNAATRIELVRKSRSYEKNNAIVNRIVDLFEQFTVGAAGLQLVPVSSSPEYNQRAMVSFETWSQFPDLTSLLTFGTIQSLCARVWFVDGEVFILKTRGETPPYRPRIQLIEGHRVETPPSMREQEGKGIVDGIALNVIGRPTGYYVREGEGKDATWRLIDAANIIHLFEPSRPGQYRGLPFVYPVINDINDLDDLQLLEMKAAKRNAEVANILKNATGELNPSLLRRQRLRNGVIDSQGNSSTDDRIDYYNEALGGTTIALKTDEDMVQFKSDRPTLTSREYWEYLTTKICAGVGISKLLVFPDSKQGTVVRAELDIANAFFRARSAVLAAVFIRIWIYVIGNDRTLGVVPADWTRVTSRPPRAVNVDVGRNSSAMLAELGAGATNFDLIFSPLGLDAKQELRKSAQFAKYIRDLATEFEITPGEIASNVGEAIALLAQTTAAEEAAAAGAATAANA